MSATEYLAAQKLGEKRYQADVARGVDPYLPVLDKIITASDVVGEINLGLQYIALGNVVGTATEGRTHAFASNFMPILDYNTEFGGKWASLCQSHLEEGIHDPIKVYEYMTKFYVIEGNKRVSVLKYFGAESIPAMVIRKMPKKTDELENKIYYEYVDFHKQTGINYMWFSQLGSYDKLREHLGISDGEPLSDDARLDFNSAHLAFEKAFLAKKGADKLKINVNDAMLIFLNIYSYEELKHMSRDEVKANVDKVWDEIILSHQKKETPVTPVLDPVDNSKPKLLNILQAKPKTLKIAFVYDKRPQDSMWIYCHELGRNDIKNKFANQVETTAFPLVDTPEKLVGCLNKIVEEKYDLVFTTSPEMLNASLKVAVAHPEIKILNCSLNTTTSHVRTYYARMYEAKFITGIIAGSLCENNKVGFVADYPISGTVANINAFALGVQMVNPNAKVYLEWSKVKGSNPKKRFEELDVHYISYIDMIVPANASREFGLFCIRDGKIRNLAMSVYNWGAFYEKIVSAILAGNWKEDEKLDEKKAVSYWWGMSAGVVDVICSAHLPKGTIRLADLMKDLIKNGKVSPFYGKIISQKDVVADNMNSELDIQDILNMTWLNDNIVGTIPKPDEIQDDAQDILAVQGLDQPENLELKKPVETLVNSEQEQR